MIFDTLINSNVTPFHTAFFHKILQTGKHIQTIPFKFSYLEAQLLNKCLHFNSHYDEYGSLANLGSVY
jgi:hypothetical protein